MKYFKRIAMAVLAVIMAASYAVNACADWYDDVSGGTYSTITGDGYVADTFCGVEARYNLSDGYYQCNELINRFYAEAYGLDILAYSNIFSMETEGYEFITPSKPKPGDIIFSPSSSRKNNGDHWAIVKSYGNGVITLFEQNVVWNGKAGTGRHLKYPSDSYEIYSPAALPGYPDPVLKGYSSSSSDDGTTKTPSTAARKSSSGMSSSEAVSEKKVTKAASTIPSSAAKKAVTSSSPVRSSSGKATTAAKVSAENITSALQVTGSTAGTAQTVTGETTAVTVENTAAAVSETSEESSAETEASQAGTVPEEENSGKITIVIAAAATALIAIGAAIFVILRKK